MNAMLLQSSAAATHSAAAHKDVEGTSSSQVATFDGRSNYCADEATAVASNFTTTHNNGVNAGGASDSVVSDKHAITVTSLEGPS